MLGFGPRTRQNVSLWIRVGSVSVRHIYFRVRFGAGVLLVGDYGIEEERLSV
mgnify:CR=1 FL=1